MKELINTRILIIIPAFNEENSIEYVISSVKKEVPLFDILVVNDGSRDRTGQIAKACGVKVIDLPYNLGIGATMQTGFRYASINNYDIAVQVDGDGQHPADQIKKLAEVVEEGEADMAVGSRFIVNRGYRPTMPRAIGMRYFSGLISLILRQRIRDTTSGFRAVNKKVVDFFSRYYPEDYPEVEAFVLLYKSGFRIKEVSIDMKERSGGRSSITSFRSLYYMVKVSLAIFIEMLRRAHRVVPHV